MNSTNRKKHISLAVANIRRRLKTELVNYKGGRCQTCGYSKSVAAMQFHHRDPTQKDFGISSGRTKSLEKLKLEVDKCDLLCANCHAEVHETNKVQEIENQKIELAKFKRTEVTIVETVCDNCGKSRLKKSNYNRYDKIYCSRKCYELHKTVGKWPSDGELERLVQTTPITEIAKMVGVSDKSVLKRCKRLGIKTHEAGYWSKIRSTSRN